MARCGPPSPASCLCPKRRARRDTSAVRCLWVYRRPASGRCRPTPLELRFLFQGCPSPRLHVSGLRHGRVCLRDPLVSHMAGLLLVCRRPTIPCVRLNSSRDTWLRVHPGSRDSFDFPYFASHARFVPVGCFYIVCPVFFCPPLSDSCIVFEDP